jgi:hypothetical protein
MCDSNFSSQNKNNRVVEKEKKNLHFEQNQWDLVLIQKKI